MTWLAQKSPVEVQGIDGSELIMHASLSSDFGLPFSLVAAPSGPATGTLSAAMPGASTIRTRGRDGSITTVVVAGLGDIVAFTTTRPDHRLSFEA